MSREGTQSQGLNGKGIVQRMYKTPNSLKKFYRKRHAMRAKLSNVAPETRYNPDASPSNTPQPSEEPEMRSCLTTLCFARGVISGVLGSAAVDVVDHDGRDGSLLDSSIIGIIVLQTEVVVFRVGLGEFRIVSLFDEAT